MFSMNNSTPSVSSLLLNLKSTVELLTQFRGDSLTSKYGAIERLRLPILAILSHQLKQNSIDIYEQLWQLIVRLNANSQRYIHLLQEIYHKENIRFSVEQWIDQSMINQCLSDQLRSMENDEDLLSQYYSPRAFLRIPVFYQAFLLCLRTIERSDPSLLMNIDPKLSIAGFDHQSSQMNHTELRSASSSANGPSTLVIESKSKDDNQKKLHPLAHQRILHRRIQSDPIFSFPNETNRSSSTVVSPSSSQFLPHPNNSNEQETIPMISYQQPETYGSYASSSDLSEVNALISRQRQQQQQQTKLTLGSSKSSQITVIDGQDRQSCDQDETILSTTSTSPMEQSVLSNNYYTSSRPRLPHSSLFWPRKGQTLDDYIRESDSKTRTDVEKENAHLYFSEAIISAVEQIKFTQQCQRQFGPSWSSSIASLISPCETTHTSSSPSSSTSPPSQQYIPCNSKLLSNPRLKHLSMARSVDDQPAEMMESTSESVDPPSIFDLSTRSSIMNSNLEESSAEAIALTLMENWKNFQVPNATELLWIIPRDADLPQTLLPLPNGISIDPSADDLTTMDGRRISCRGNERWAPPREQLIFHIHHSTNRDVQLKEQHYLCAGCGRHVEKAYAHRYRYCEYTDKYFCRSCHSNRRTFLPSYIFMRWDFSSNHSVSNFAFHYLNRIRNDPIFNLHDLNKKLFEKSRKLRIVDDHRWSLYYLQQYILHCRLAQEKGAQDYLRTLPTYLYTNPYVYSIDDLFQTKSGDLIKVLDPVVHRLRDHVLTCEICCGQGHICQICQNRDDIIFPFDREMTSVCPGCKSCFHLTCHERKNFSCPKCPRKKKRRSDTNSNRSSTPTDVPSANDEDVIT